MYYVIIIIVWVYVIWKQNNIRKLLIVSKEVYINNKNLNLLNIKYINQNYTY